MRKYILIVLFIPLIGFGQYQTTNLDFLFNGSITVNGSDTLLVDSITGTFDVGYVLTDVDFDITLGPMKNLGLVYNPKTGQIGLSLGASASIPWVNVSIPVDSQAIGQGR